MNKLKIHELAKELNVSSKRLMEKLEEINIHPKSHMSTLEDDELDKLYKHIGFVNRNKLDSSAHSDSDVKADHADSIKKNAPRIIRKTEVVIRDEYNAVDDQKDKKKKGFVRSSDTDDGLMAGYTRGIEDIISNIKKRPKNEAEESPQHEEKPAERFDSHDHEKAKKPVDDILSVKKVTHKHTEQPVENNLVNEQEKMQKENVMVEKPHIPETPKAELHKAPDTTAHTPVKEEDRQQPKAEAHPSVDKGPVREHVKAESEVPVKHAADIHAAERQEQKGAPVEQRADKQELKQESVQDRNAAAHDRAPRQEQRQDQGHRQEQRTDQRHDFRQDHTNRQDHGQRNDRDFRNDRPQQNRNDRPYSGDNRPRNEGNYQPRPQDGRFENRNQGGDFQRRDGAGGDYQRRQGGDFQRQGGDFQRREGGDFQRRDNSDYQRNQSSGGDFQRRQGGDFQRREGGDFQRNQGGDFQRRDQRPQQQGDFQRRDNSDYQRNQNSGGDFQRRQGGDFQRREGGDFQRREGGDFQRREGGDFQRRQGGDFQRREGGDFQRREGGDFQRREGGDYQRNQSGGGDFQRRQGGDFQRQGGDFQRQGGDFQRRNDGPRGDAPRGDWKPREGGHDYQRRDGGGQPRGDWKPGGFGDKPEFRRRPDGDNRGDGRRPDGGGFSGNRNRPLAIPKVQTPSGTTEEKVFTRGERRTFQGVEKQKEEKKEQKKDVSRSSTTAVPDKNNKFKKKIDIVGQKANVSDMMSDEFVIDVFYDDQDEAINAKRAEKKLKRGRLEKVKHIPPKAVLTEITIPEAITVKGIAEALKKTTAEIIKKLFLMGVTATQNQELDFDTAALLGDEYGVKVHQEIVVSREEILFDDSADQDVDLEARPPVVVVMGHVDHGKTSLLDAIRSENIAESEAGGITQHIGAYTVNLHGRDITFLDTPGHEAFTAMRARGAKVTDIAILVVAADDGVMPQTIEAINHAKAAGVAIIVAINKIDKANANPDRVKQELTQQGLLIEEWGGDIIAVPVSAKQKTNIDQLLEMVLLTADVLELKADPDKQAKGTVIEAKLDKNRGPVATLLVQRGTLKVGDAIISGSTFGRIRAMLNDKGRKIKEAGPSIPVEIIGLAEVPEAGELFYAVKDERVAKELAEQRREDTREKTIGRSKISLDDLFSQIQKGEVKDLNLIIKADVQGSVEAIKQSMEKLSNDEVKVKVIHGGVGAIIEADVKLAEVSGAIIIGFNVRPAANVLELAGAAEVDMRLYRVIYEAIEDMQKAMKGMLKPTFKEVVDGHIEIRQLFKVSNVGTIGGSYVTDGKIVRNSDVRLVRNGIVIFEGKLASLKRFKDDVKEVAYGYECGVMLEKYNDIKEGDVVEAFHMEEVQRQ